MISAATVRNASRVLSIRDISYELKPFTSFHPSMVKASIRRICKEFNYECKTIIGHTLRSNAANRVWAVVFEYKGEPTMIMRNLAFTHVKMPYRRVLRVSMDAILKAVTTQCLDYLSKDADAIFSITSVSEDSVADDSTEDETAAEVEQPQVEQPVAYKDYAMYIALFITVITNIACLAMFISRN